MASPGVLKVNQPALVDESKA